LAYPERIEAGVASLDLFAIAQLDFERPDLQRFPCLALAYQALKAGGNASAVLNAANEVAVAAFLEGRLPFLRIADVISAALDAVPSAQIANLTDVLAADGEGRVAARQALARWLP
jgi:1-deoxy-D-xylulose-5-phosphate reductoisomerase